LEFLWKNNHITQIGLGDERDALYAVKILGPGKCYAHPMPGVCTVGEKIFSLHGVYAEVFYPELFICCKSLLF
jgi:hypothetical protein